MTETSSPATTNSHSPAEETPISFLDFSPRIRHDIYTLYFHNTISVHLSSCKSNKSSTDPPTAKHALSLLQASWLIHSEATPTLYGTITFTTTSPQDLKTWLSQIGASAAFLRRIEIQCASDPELILSLLTLQLENLPGLKTIIHTAELSSSEADEKIRPTHLLKGTREISGYLEAFVGRVCTCQIHKDCWPERVLKAEKAWDVDNHNLVRRRAFRHVVKI